MNRPQRLVDDSDEELALDKVQPKTPVFVYVLTFFSAIGGFLFGYDAGVISGSIILLRDAFALSNTLWKEAIVSGTIGAAALFSIIGGYLNDLWGRKPVIFTASFVFTSGAIVLGIANNKEMILAGRIIVGAGIGLASMTIPMYIAEAAPSHLRGRLVTLNNVFITGGQCIACIIAGLFSKDTENGWRYMLGLAAIPGIIQFFGFLFLPESPRWLIIKGKYEKARRVLRSIRGASIAVDEEFEIIKANCLETDREREERGHSPIIIQMLKAPHLRWSLLIGCGLQMIQQLAGINTIMYYSGSIIQMAGVKDNSLVIWLTTIPAGVNFLCTFIGLYLVDRIGRRLLILGSLAGTIISLMVLAVGFQLVAMNSPSISYKEPFGDSCVNHNFCESCIEDSKCGFCFEETPSGVNGTCVPSTNGIVAVAGSCHNTTHNSKVTWAYEWCPSSFFWMPILGLVVYLFFFAPGMGPMPWTVNSEIYPHWARSTGNAVSASVNWFCNLAVSISFLSLTEALTKYGTFWLYTGLAILGFIFIFFLLPETKGKSLEEVEGLFAKPWCRDGTLDGNKMVQYVHIRGLNRDCHELDSPD